VDVGAAAVHCKLVADRNNARGQCCYAKCLERRTGIAFDLDQAMIYYQLSAGNGDPEAQCLYGLRWFAGDNIDISTMAYYLRLSALGWSAPGQLNYAHFLDEGIGIDQDHILADQDYKLLSESFPSARACYGWCLQIGCGVPINFTEAVEVFQKATDGGNPDGANRLAGCFDLGRGLEKDTERSRFDCRRAASQHHRSRMNNFGRCLEYRQSIDTDYVRAAKCYRLAAELKNAKGVNDFGICLERVLGVKSTIDLTVEYYKWSVDAGNAAGSTNFGFCFEHGRGVGPNIELTVGDCKRAADCGQSEAEQNFRRCLRLLGRWTVPTDHRLSRRRNHRLKNGELKCQMVSRHVSKRLLKQNSPLKHSRVSALAVLSAKTYLRV
jgi:TPR repeat protein